MFKRYEEWLVQVPERIQKDPRMDLIDEIVKNLIITADQQRQR